MPASLPGLRCTSRLLTLHMLQAARREHLLRAERQEPRMLQGSALDVFPTRGPGLLSIHEWPVRPFLARLLYSLMRATNKQSDQACGSPAWLVPASWLSPFSLGAEEIIGKEKKSRRDMGAGWARWQQYLPALLMRASTRIPGDTNKDCAVGLSKPTAVLARPAFMSAP